MNWLQKISQTGFLDTQPFGQTYRMWDDIEKERQGRAKLAQEKATTLAIKNGHDLKPFSAINTSQCKKCGREVTIYNTNSRSGTRFLGRALMQECDDTQWDTSNDIWEYRHNSYQN